MTLKVFRGGRLEVAQRAGLLNPAVLGLQVQLQLGVGAEPLAALVARERAGEMVLSLVILEAGGVVGLVVAAVAVEEGPAVLIVDVAVDHLPGAADVVALSAGVSVTLLLGC